MSANDQRLNSWKEIAAYLGKGVRTVIRWEKTEDLPVHRHQHDSRASVFAYKSELDEWWENRPGLRTTAMETHSEPTARRSVFGKWLVLGGLATAASSALVMSWWLRKQEIPDFNRLHIEPLTSYEGRQSSPTFSPDGSHFAFSWNGVPGNQDIWVQTVGMTERRRLTSDPAWELSPAWSPDGRWIAFIRRTEDFIARLCIIPANGGSERHLQEFSIPVFAEATELSWSPDSEWLVYPDAPATDKPGLYIIHVQSGDRRRLTEASRVREHLDPSLSPDGRTLAFRCHNEEKISEICVLAVTADWRAGGKTKQITNLRMRSTSPVWTWDGKSIFFSAGNSQASLYQVTASPVAARWETPMPVTRAFGEEHYSLAMPPHARLPAFTRKRSDINIWQAVSDGAQWRTAIKASGLSSIRRDMDPDFSPDGRKIVFTSDRSGSMELWIADAEGQNTTQLTQFRTRYVGRPKFSPDGRSIAFCEGDTSVGSVWMISASGGVPKEIKRGAWYPSWSRVGDFIYYSSPEGLFKVRAGGGGPPLAIAGPGSCCAWESSDGRFILFARDGAVWKRSASGFEGRVFAPPSAPAMMFRFVGTDAGIYTFHESVPHPPVRLYRFPDGPLVELFQVRERSAPGFAVSPNRRQILFAQEDGTQVDIAILRSQTQ